MYRILHLSDLHAREKSQWSTTPILKEAKKAIVAEASKVNIDLVVFTGDIAFSGKKAEYDIAQAWLDDLCLGTGGMNVDKGQILTIPGNHDVDRSLITSGANSIERTLFEAKSQANVAQIYQEADSRELLLKRHKAYFEFCSTFLGITSSHCWSKTFKAGNG
jgi:3',5'-cyclic AMP phosphodiesterase CpdA